MTTEFARRLAAARPVACPLEGCGFIVEPARLGVHARIAHADLVSRLGPALTEFLLQWVADHTAEVPRPAGDSCGNPKCVLCADALGWVGTEARP